MPIPSAARRVAAGLVASALIAGAATAEVPSRNLAPLANRDEYPVAPPGVPYAYSACWSYIHGDGREYAILGVATGTAIYNVTDPANPYRVGFIPGPTSIWREMKSYRNWIYIVTEGTGIGEGLQIVRMTDPEAPVLVSSYTTGFTHSHTVQVDTSRALLVCNGTRDDPGNATGMHVLSLANPEAPVELSRWPAGSGIPSSAQYVHDCVMVGNRLYASSVYAGIERVLDITDPAAPTEIAEWTYPTAYYTHSAWPDATNQWLYVTDEQNGQPLRAFDISNLASPQLVNQLTCNPAAIVHNPRVKGSTLYLANYTEGVRVLDLSDPVHPAEFAWADTYPGLSGGYGGVWDVCPYFPSGTVVASDMESGLYVFRPQANYGLLRVRVVDGLGQPFPDQTVVLGSDADSLRTTADGIVQFAPSPGLQSVWARRFGYFDVQESRTVGVGTRDTVTLTMIERPSAPVTGTVTDALTHAPLQEAEVTLTYTPRHAHTDAQGHYDLGLVPDHFYQLEVRRAGYVPSVGLYDFGAAPTVHDVALDATRTWDALESPSGWTVGAPGDNASSGVWVRVSPLGTGPPPVGPAPAAAPRLADPLHEEPASTSWGNAQPYFDHTPGAGTQCFVTGQGTNSANADEADVDFGITTLTSPALDLTGMVRPTIDYWRWFYSWYGSTGQPEPDDWLAVSISNDNGATWVAVDTTRGEENHWEEQTIEVARYLTPSAQMKLRFVAADRGFASIVEAAVDDITTYDPGYGPLGVPPAAGRALRFRSPWPNPATGAVTLVLELPAAGPAEVELLDTAGRRVRTLHRGSAAAGPLVMRWDGAAEDGRPAPPGLYFARARWGRSEARARFARLR